MVSAGILNTTFSSVDSSASVSANNSKTDSSDFTKILSSQSKPGKENGLVKNDSSGKSDEVKEIVKKFYTDQSKPVSDGAELSEEEIVQASANVYTQIIDVIADNLECDPQEIEQIMDDLDIKPEELLDNQNINQIVCEFTGLESNMDILTDDSLSAAVKDIYSEIDNLVSEMDSNFGINKEELKELFSKMNVSEPNITDENFEILENADADSEEMLQNVKTNEVPENIETDAEEVQNNNIAATKTDESKTSDDNELSEKGSSDSERSTFTGNETAENKLTDIISNLRETIAENISGEDNGIADKIIKQITEDVKLYAKPDMTSLEIQLEPESLGKVSLTVASKAGAVTAQLAVQNEVAREAIESQMTTLKESLNNQGIKVEAIEVTLASKEFEQNLDKEADTNEQNSGKRRKHISSDELAEINGISTGEETVMETMMKEMGSTVNYSA